MPQAQRLGLHYVAHLPQADQQYDILTTLRLFTLPFELQIFDDISEAQEWLRACRSTKLLEQ